MHELHKIVKNNTNWYFDRIYAHMNGHPLQKSGVVSLDSLKRGANGRYDAIIGVSASVGGVHRCLEISSDTTIGNMGKFRSANQDVDN